MEFTRSQQLYEESVQYLPGGVNSPVRAFRAVDRHPLFIDHAKGAYLYDADGNQYIDYVCSWGPCILGHAHPCVVRAVQRACEGGLTFGAPTEQELTLAKLIRACMPSMEVSRLVSSGTEAVMSAVRLARGFTGRDKIIKFRGCYHGHSDGLLVKAGSGALTQSAPDSLGVPADYAKLTLVAEYNHPESVERLFAEHPGEIAALLVEPVAANMGVVPPESGFLSFLREITKDHGALLIFDEVITGFRLGPGGAQEYYGVTPDLTTLGKIIGGGMPVGAYGGKREIMELVAPSGAVYQAGTLSGNPLATAAGIETLTVLSQTPGIYAQLDQNAKRLAAAMRESFGERVRVNQAGSLVGMFFTGQNVMDYETAVSSDTAAYARYFHAMIKQGIYLAPSQYEAMFVSAAHGEAEITKTCEALRSAGERLGG
ncbi:MAG: glutamate-1-semialdehyde 2,1-aminomutase [Roseburia sp.]|jgi:glutamate-1-semialdehyde 2,1-aminomutase|nr:glutamate-1-semialdehyde 2,1-aminomutase [Roseburia sp.]